MATYFNDIHAALDGHLATLGNTPIAWTNVKFEPTGDVYLRPRVLPVSTEQASLGNSGKDDTNGIYQIDVFVKQGNGRSALLDSIADHFKRGTVLTHNSVSLRVRTVELAPSSQDGTWHFTPVSVYFQTYTGART